MRARVVQVYGDERDEQIIHDAAIALGQGKSVIFPTDTVYGLGANPGDERAVKSLFSLKGRVEEKPIAVLAADLDQVRRWGMLSAAAEALAQAFWPGPLTLILPPAPAAPPWLIKRGIGLRVPGFEFARKLCAAAGGAIAATSANLANAPAPENSEDMVEVFGNDVAMIILRPGPAPASSASTVVDLCGPEPDVLRSGPITAAMIRRAISPLGRDVR